MNIVMWILAGGVLGWVGYSFLGFNRAQGILVSMTMGVVGGLLGGNTIAPLFTATPALTGDFNSSALFFAAGTAAALLVLCNLAYDRWAV
ncbi:MAG: hypothetical protein EPO20_12070 [Betaproteobacteria bacterium]|nr:MAG: hypothetical protein EPO20_12070 [Betaproteobacteria bacterium]